MESWILPASDAAKGNRVLVTSRSSDLTTHVHSFTHIVEVFEVVFVPDEPVKSFILPGAEILTLGQQSGHSHCMDEGRVDTAKPA